MVLTDDLLTFLGEMIQGDPDSWENMLTKSRGKGNVQLKLIQHLAIHTNPRTQGRASTPETVSKWINAGFELAEKEAARRSDGGVAGRQIPNDQVPKPQRERFHLVQYYPEWQKEQPTTSRYTTPPVHLRGKLELKFDNIASLPICREEKEAGAELREKAVAKVAEERDSKRKVSSDSREHLHPRRMRTESVAATDNTDKFMDMYMATEIESNKQ